MYVQFGFDALRRTGAVTVEPEAYEDFERRGAPPREGAPYHSHKNIVVLEILIGSRTVRAVYDANDIYYKIPPRLLDWCDVYFKSNYQEPYLQTGRQLDGDYWETIPFFDALVPEPLDTAQSLKFRRANFSMELHDAIWRNRLYFAMMEGRWLRTAPARKRSDVFFLGRYWSETRAASLALVDAVRGAGKSLLGGLVEAKDPVPASHRALSHKPVGLDRWCRMAANARVAVITRGLQGCVGFKPLNLLMLGAPFIANRLMSNLRTPIREGVNYLVAADDFSDLPDILRATSAEQLHAMGEANLRLWRDVASPAATAAYILDECQKLAEAGACAS